MTIEPLNQFVSLTIHVHKVYNIIVVCYEEVTFARERFSAATLYTVKEIILKVHA